MSTADALGDPERIADEADLDESIGAYATMILERLEREEYQIPDDGRTYPAVVYVAARDEGEPVTVEEVAEAAGISETAVSREYKRVVQELDLDGLELVSADEFIRRYAEDLRDVDPETEQVALDLFREGSEAGLFGSRSPSVSAATCLYAAGRLTDADLPQYAFEEFGVSEISVRKFYRDVLSLRDEEITETMSDDTDALITAVEEIHTGVKGVPDPLLASARELVHTVEGADFLGESSAETVAAALYWLAAEDNRIDVTQGEVAEVVDAHTTTVNRRVADVREFLDANRD